MKKTACMRGGWTECDEAKGMGRMNQLVQTQWWCPRDPDFVSLLSVQFSIK